MNINFSPVRLAFSGNNTQNNTTGKQFSAQISTETQTKLVPLTTLPANILRANFLGSLAFKGSSKLEDNLQLARETVDYVKSLKLISNTELEMKGLTGGENYEDYTKSISDRMFLDRKRNNKPIDEFIKITKELTPLLHTGNCAEQAILAAVYLHEKKNIDNFAMVAAIEVTNRKEFEEHPIKHGYNANNHVFVVIGLANNADLNKPETWGKDAVIVDPWSNTVAPALNNDDNTQNGICKIKKLPLFRSDENIEFINYAPFIDPTKDPDSVYNWENHSQN